MLIICSFSKISITISESKILHFRGCNYRVWGGVRFLHDSLKVEKYFLKSYFHNILIIVLTAVWIKER